MDGSLAGKLLIAMPGMGDPRFANAVILVCMHTEEAAMGLVVNKVKPRLKLGDVLEHLHVDVPAEVAARPVLNGGPVKPDRGHVLHSNDFNAGAATQPISDEISLTSTRDVLEALGRDDSPERYVLALGYSGWSAGQLEQEILHNAWLIVEPQRAIVFSDDHEGKWKKAIRSLGIDPSMLTGEGGRA